jgi:hypothetical protein
MCGLWNHDETAWFSYAVRPALMVKWHMAIPNAVLVSKKASNSDSAPIVTSRDDSARFLRMSAPYPQWRPAPAHLGDGNLVSHVPADASMTRLQSPQTLQTADGKVAMNDGYSFVTELLWKNITAITLELQIRFEGQSAPIMHFLTALRVGLHFYPTFRILRKTRK